MPRNPLPLLQGTLDLLVLRCLSGGARHGYAIASMVREQTGGHLSIEDAALPVLACAVPAWRAMRVQPAVVLRNE